MKKIIVLIEECKNEFDNINDMMGNSAEESKFMSLYRACFKLNNSREDVYGYLKYDGDYWLMIQYLDGEVILEWQSGNIDDFYVEALSEINARIKVKV